jgi:hypothetical protein
MVGFGLVTIGHSICRGFPADFPAVACERRNVLEILRARRAITPCRRWRWNGRTSLDGVWRASVSTMATPASIHAGISALVKVADRLSITAQARSSIESRVAWSGARLSTPCTQLAVNFELAAEAINAEFVKG